MQKQYVNGELVDLNPNELEGVEQLKIDAVETAKQKWIMRRQMAYPPVTDWLDGMVKGDQAQMDKYVADCLAVKDKYPKS
tara:strand:+ start:308 stop:547 length:240 start_codon:yes stop_codon:yes gene_type:complete